MLKQEWHNLEQLISFIAFSSLHHYNIQCSVLKQTSGDGGSRYDATYYSGLAAVGLFTRGWADRLI